ncbi:MAG TPA: membrane dipeptidase [Candidatus Limnocylindrales bacterium]|nr:membrane dipeptidase [Candidatus Limnocylindrales bacterium]
MQTTRRGALATLAAAPFINLNRYALAAPQHTEVSSRAITLVKESLVIDMLDQFLYRLDMQDKLRRWMTQPGAFTAVDIQRFKDSGINAISFGDAAADYDSGIKLFADWNAFLAMYPDWLLRISTSGDLARVKSSGRYGIILGLQNSTHFRRVEDVDTFYGLGQRSGQVTYNFRNLLGNGAFEPHDEGLSDFGARIVERMNQVNMAVDCGHVGDHTMADTFDVSKKPVIISHGNCRALNPGYLRCVPDENIKKMAAKGGVMGINFISFMVKPTEPTTVDDVIDHIDHVRDLVGIEHAGIGSDFGIESNDFMPADALRRVLEGADKRYKVHHREAVGDLAGDHRTFILTEALIRRKYTDAQIRLILGENWKRVLTEIWG